MADSSRRTGLTGLALSSLTLAVLGYFSFAATQGDYGLFRLIEVEAEEARLDRELSHLRAERAVIAGKTRRLSSDYLDLDLLDEQARKVLGLARGDELIIR